MERKKFDSKGEEMPKIGIERFLDSSILKKRNKQSSLVEGTMKNSWKLQSLPRNRAPIRLHRCCFFARRPRANYRDFGISGHILREMFHACLLPGATRSSW